MNKAKSMKEEITNASTIATLTTTLGFMQASLAEIKAELKALNTTFASKEELANTARDTEIRIVRLERSSNLWRWLSPSLAAALGAILAVLVLSYLTKIH